VLEEGVQFVHSRDKVLDLNMRKLSSSRLSDSEQDSSAQAQEAEAKPAFAYHLLI
jgi:hypothetical protein